MAHFVPFNAAAQAEEFLSRHFDKVSVEQNESGVTCAVPGFFALKHIPRRTPSGRFLREVQELSVDAPDREQGIILLANTVHEESVILKHFPKEGDLYQPRVGAEYVIIDREDPLHHHGHKGFIDFNMVMFSEGELDIGSTGDEFEPYWHVHLAPASDIST